MKAYTDKQIRAGDLLEDVTINGDKIPSEIISQIVEIIGEKGESYQSTPLSETQNATDIIRIQMQNEPDWRKRAAMAALLISRSLD